MNSKEQVTDIAILTEKLGGMERGNDLKYASFKELSATKITIGVCEERISGLERRFGDHVSAQKYMMATIFSSVSLVIAIIMAAIGIGSKFTR